MSSLLLVEYTNTTWLNAEEEGNNNMFPAEPAGHGRAGPGGHYTGTYSIYCVE